MKHYHTLVIALFVCTLICPTIHVHAQADLPVVRAVLFYSTTCGHCEYVINETLLPMVKSYGDQLQIVTVEVNQPGSQELFGAAMQKFGLEHAGVPFLVFGDTYLIWSADIPDKFPGLVESYLAQGGLDWPDIPGLREALGSPASVTQPAPAQTTPIPATVDPASVSSMAPPVGLSDAHDVSWKDKFAHDVAGNTLAVIVLIGILLSMIWSVILFQRADGVSLKENWAWIIPILCIIGFGVAGYLAYVETTQTDAVCGPIGDCNTVQQSSYARLFGILPIGVLGLAGYVAIVFAWLFARYGRESVAALGTLTLFGMTAFGTLFSIYLTFLEPFVIGATCAWCLTSAVLMTVLLLFSIRPAKLTFSNKNLIPLLSRHTRTTTPND